MLGAFGELAEVISDRGQIKLPFPREVGDAESATEIEKTYWRRCMTRKLEGEFVGFLLCIANGFRLEVLRTSKQVESFEC